MGFFSIAIVRLYNYSKRSLHQFTYLHIFRRVTICYVHILLQMWRLKKNVPCFVLLLVRRFYLSTEHMGLSLLQFVKQYCAKAGFWIISVLKNYLVIGINSKFLIMWKNLD